MRSNPEPTSWSLLTFIRRGVRSSRSLGSLPRSSFSSVGTSPYSAIRDFYDIDFAVRRLGIPPGDPALIRLVRQKLAVPGNRLADVSDQRLPALTRRVGARLEPVLHEADLAGFELHRTSGIVVKTAETVIGTGHGASRTPPRLHLESLGLSTAGGSGR